MTSGEFRTITVLGRGSFGVVSLVESLTGQRYAAKRVELGGPGALSHALTEILMWCDLPQHAHLLQFRFFRTEPDALTIFSDYAPGGSVADVLRGSPVTSLATVLDVGIQSLTGLSALHANGILHRDVKPHNLFVSADGRILVGDFGLSGESYRQSGARTTPVGSLAFASPEQLDQGTLTTAADIYSWARSMMFIALGPDTFREAGRSEASVRRFFEEANDTSGTLPPPIADILRSALLDDPAARPQDAWKLAEDLAMLFEETLGRAYDWSSPIRPARHLPERSGRRSERWFAARRITEEVFRCISHLERTTVSPELEKLWMTRPQNMSAAAGENGMTERAQLVHALAILEAARTAAEEALKITPNDRLRDTSVHVCSEMLGLFEYLGDKSGAAWMQEVLTAMSRRLDGKTFDESARAIQLQRDLAIATSHADRLLEARDRFRAALDGALALPPGVNDEWRFNLIFALNVDLGLLAERMGDVSAAVLCYEMAFNPHVVAHDRIETSMRGWALNLRACALDHAGRSEEALICFEQAIALLESLERDREGLSRALLNKAVTLRRLGRAQDGLLVIEQALRLRMSAAAEAELDWQRAHELAGAFHCRGDLLALCGKQSEARASYVQAHKIWHDLVNAQGHTELLEDLRRVDRMLSGSQ